MKRLALGILVSGLSVAAACFSPVDVAVPYAEDGGVGDGGAIDASVLQEDGGTDAGCGDPAITDRWSACTKSTDAAECEQQGGTWFDWYCQCRTGQGGCPCTRSSDCLGACLAPIPSGDADCPSAGTCSDHTPTLGCHCWFSENGTAAPACAD